MSEPMGAEDATDLDQAQRIIVNLRRMVNDTAKDAEPLEGEFTVFLDEKHLDLLHMLFKARKLFHGQDDD